MSNKHYLNKLQFNFDAKEDIPELFVRAIENLSRTLALQKILTKYIAEFTEKTEEEIGKEIDELVSTTKHELYAQLASERGE